MANVLLTQRCVRNCPYCFAKEHMEGKTIDDNLKWDDLIYVADFFIQSDSRVIHLLGGEPTLHPHYVDFVLYLIDRGLSVTTFTSGIMSPKKLKEMEQHLSCYDHKKLAFVVNVNDPADSPATEIEKQKEFFGVFAKNSNPGFNIYKADFSFDFIFDYYKTYPDLYKRIRVGLTHPIVGEKNYALPKEDMSKMAKKFISYIPQLEEKGIVAGFDCGMPMCLFSDEEIGKMYKMTKGNLKFQCGSAIDIGPDLSVWSCFPLANVDKKSLYEFDNIQGIHEYYLKMHRETRDKKGGLFPECQDCKYRSQELCAGGCLAHIL